MHDIRQEKPHFLERINPEHIKSVVCVKPKMDNATVVRQDGAFLMFGIGQNKHKFAEIPKEWMLYSSEKRVMKATDKTNILQQLASVGISKAKLFPEIDSVAQFIKDDFGLSDVV